MWFQEDCTQFQQCPKSGEEVGDGEGAGQKKALCLLASVAERWDWAGAPRCFTVSGVIPRDSFPSMYTVPICSSTAALIDM